MIPYVLFHSLMSSLLFYNVENSKNKEKPLNEKCACLFHKCGAKLILCGATGLTPECESLTSGADPKVTFPPKLVLLDFSDMDGMPEVVDEVVDEVVECCGCVDVLLCNSSMKLKAVHTASLELDRNIMDINYQHIGQSTSCMDILHSSLQNLLYGCIT
uniref:Dehydrogenase/reductase (SDR family) member 7Cb n=1 Tax=Salmo trutta TaxID=8032 RepID=A0A673W2I2_SALTR